MLIKCPECKTEISDQSKECRKCGYPIQKMNNNTNVIVKNSEGCFMKTLNIGCIIFIIIGGMILFGALITVLQQSKYSKSIFEKKQTSESKK